MGVVLVVGWLLVVIWLTWAMDLRGCRFWGCWMMVGAVIVLAVWLFVAGVLRV